MSVKLVSITEAIPGLAGTVTAMTNGILEHIDVHLTPEDLIVYVARVSNPNNQMNLETSDRLIRYLLKHKHWSPFEFVDMTVQIVTRRSIAAQILRHKSFSFQEFSQRYAEATTVQDIELRRQSLKNRQSSTEVFDPVINSHKQLTHASKIVKEHTERAIELYNDLLEAGVAREVARDVLPLATETTMYMKGSVRSWIHYLELRLDETTQEEHRAVAEGIMGIFMEKFPTISEVLWNTKQ
jgi:thymidylate synthase (FAD)